jgi:hypothetical protein
MLAGVLVLTEGFSDGRPFHSHFIAFPVYR